MLGNMQMAQDLVQHTFIRIWEQRLYLEIQQSVGGFLYQQVHLDCLKQLQQHPKNTDDEKYQQSKPNELADEQKELRKQMLSKLSELPTEKLKLVIEDPRIRFT
jgi:DNA-directed RNA polymerase specialized sigma24 family protein